MPRYDLSFKTQTELAINIVKAGESSRASEDRKTRKLWTPEKIEALYELAYLRSFVAWEMCLESVFFMTLCGYASSVGQEVITNGVYYKNQAAAEAAIMPPKKPYLLWSDPLIVANRCKAHIITQHIGFPPGGLLERVVSSKLSYLEKLGHIRHRIAHGQRNAMAKFDVATMVIAGRRYTGSRPGKFLSDWDTSTVPPRRWLESALIELVSLSAQMV